MFAQGSADQRTPDPDYWCGCFFSPCCFLFFVFCFFVSKFPYSSRDVTGGGGSDWSDDLSRAPMVLCFCRPVPLVLSCICFSYRSCHPPHPPTHHAHSGSARMSCAPLARAARLNHYNAWMPRGGGPISIIVKRVCVVRKPSSCESRPPRHAYLLMPS